MDSNVVISGRYDRDSVTRSSSGAKVHLLENIMMMCHDARCLSDRLTMWLESIVRML